MYQGRAVISAAGWRAGRSRPHLSQDRPGRSRSARPRRPKARCQGQRSCRKAPHPAELDRIKFAGAGVEPAGLAGGLHGEPDRIFRRHRDRATWCRNHHCCREPDNEKLLSATLIRASELYQPGFQRSPARRSTGSRPPPLPSFPRLCRPSSAPHRPHRPLEV